MTNDSRETDDTAQDARIDRAPRHFRDLDDMPPSFWKEFLLFIKQEKKWWLIPILLVLLAIGALVALSGTGAAPFIYPLM